MSWVSDCIDTWNGTFPTVNLENSVMNIVWSNPGMISDFCSDCCIKGHWLILKRDDNTYIVTEFHSYSVKMCLTTMNKLLDLFLMFSFIVAKLSYLMHHITYSWKLESEDWLKIIKRMVSLGSQRFNINLYYF